MRTPSTVVTEEIPIDNSLSLPLPVFGREEERQVALGVCPPPVSHTHLDIAGGSRDAKCWKKSTAKALFITRRLQDIAEESGNPLVMRFVDWEKASDKVDQNW